MPGQKNQDGCRALLLFGLICDFGALVFYKYAGFLLGIFGAESALLSGLSLPLGISFFIFSGGGLSD